MIWLVCHATQDWCEHQDKAKCKYKQQPAPHLQPTVMSVYFFVSCHPLWQVSDKWKGSFILCDYLSFVLWTSFILLFEKTWVIKFQVQSPTKQRSWDILDHWLPAICSKALTHYPEISSVTDPVFIFIHPNPSPWLVRQLFLEGCEFSGNHNRSCPMITAAVLQFHPVPAWEFYRCLK